MKNTYRTACSLALASALMATSPALVNAEDIDLFVGSTPSSAANRPNVLIIIDNSANWSAANQHWPGGIKQGESELRSLRTVVGELTDSVNVGLMMFTEGQGSDKNGAYPRFAMRQMTAGNKAALQELLGTTSCTDGLNSLNGTDNCLVKNFDRPDEKTGTAKTDYSAAMFEAFKYFGGYTSPANAKNDVAGSPVSPSQFGPLRYAGTPSTLVPRKRDPFAYNPTSQIDTYNPPITALNSCAKNYIIFIGNGFPTQDSPASLLSGVGGNTSQLPMQQYSTTSATQTANIGFACSSSGNNAGQRLSSCTGNIPQSLKDANPADSYTCIAPESVDATVCPGSAAGNNIRKFAVQSTSTVITVAATGGAAVPSSSDARMTDEWAKFLYTTDVSSALGQQNVATYTIDVFKDAPDARQTALLNNMAKVGGGRYFQASNEGAILNALREILVEIQAVNTVFASASLPINATNRSQNENQVFIGMFRPDANAKPRWYGNLKRYQIALFGGEAKLADKDGLEAVAASTGFVQSCASSYWTTDSGNYWSFSPDGAGLCLTSGTNVFSDLPDGPIVEKGATAEVVRKGNNPPATNTTPTYAFNRTLYTCNSTLPCTSMLGFDSTNVSASELGVATSTERDKILEHTRGKDVNDENGNFNFTETRPSLHGDVAHSRPLPVNYGGTTGVVVYYGANDGVFRAMSGETGKELWGFVAPEHYKKLKRLTDNSPIIAYPGTPTTIVPTPQKKDYFFDGSAGLFQNADNSKVWIFPTMRRGGRAVYAFDVTTPASPVLKWKRGCPNDTDDTNCSTGFEGIGQTWSIPNVTFITSFNSGNDPVLIFGGGYDSCEDNDVSAPSCSGGGVKGKKVYIVNADTGALIRSFDTDRSVAADITLVDRNFDGKADHAYVADTGGNLYRIDFVNPATLAPLTSSASWTITKIARTNVSPAGRKFLFGPAALPASDRVILTIGTGDRERPLQSNYPYGENIQNRFYQFTDIFTSGTVDLDGSNVTDLTSSNACSAALATGARGWRIDLNSGRGEQTVTSSVIFGGLVFFSTNRPVPAAPGVCTGDLGEARGYAVNLLNASGAVGTEALCGGSRSNIFTGGGLPPSPVTGVVPIGGQPVSIMIGGISRSGGASSPIGSQKVKPTITQKRSRTYWYTHGDK